jgi:hypothetical protein
MSTHHSDEQTEVRIQNGKTLKGIVALFNFVGGLSGLLSLLLVALVGGQYMKQVEVNTHRLDRIESGGSPTVQALEKSLSLEVEARREADSVSGKRLDDYRLDFSQRINNITQLLEKLVEQQTTLISLIRVQQQQNNK